MLFYSESGVISSSTHVWERDGQYPIISMGRYVFTKDFKVTKGNTVLTEGIDYLRLLRNKDIYMRFGIDIFAGILLLSPVDSTVEIFGITSAPCTEVLPPSTPSPYAAELYSSEVIMPGSYQNTLEMVDEVEKLIPYIIGVSLPTYVFSDFTYTRPYLTDYVHISIVYHPVDMGFGYDTPQVLNKVPARSDYIAGGIDSIPIDFIADLDIRRRYTSLQPRINIMRLNGAPLGAPFINSSDEIVNMDVVEQLVTS